MGQPLFVSAVRRFVSCVLCAVLVVLPVTVSSAAAADDVTRQLWEIRLDSLDHEAAAKKLAGDHRLGNVDLADYYSRAVTLETESAALYEKTFELEEQLDPRRARENSAYQSALEDALGREKRNDKAIDAKTAAFNSGDYVTERKYHIELLPLARQKKAITEEIGMIRWQVANRTAGGDKDLQDDLWEAKYRQYGIQRDMDAVSYGLTAGILTRQQYMDRRTQLESAAVQAKNRVEEVEKLIARRAYSDSPAIREFKYNDYHNIIMRLDEIEDELKHLEWKWEDKTITFSEYKNTKKNLEQEKKDLIDEKRSYGYNDDIH